MGRIVFRIINIILYYVYVLGMSIPEKNSDSKKVGYQEIRLPICHLTRLLIKIRDIFRVPEFQIAEFRIFGFQVPEFRVLGFQVVRFQVSKYRVSDFGYLGFSYELLNSRILVPKIF